MPFDPDAYLAKKGGTPPGVPQTNPSLNVKQAGASGGFDPDAYLQKKSSLSTPAAKLLEPETVQEMHPDFSVADRFVTKNFSNDDQASVDYLKKRHPNLDIQLDPKTNQIKARSKVPGKDDGKFRVLDPDLGIMGEITHPGEMLQDLGDVGYDALAGIGTTAASAAGGLAGAPSVVGALPAAAAAGAGAGAGLEGIRQGIGGLLGVNNDANLAQVGLAGVGGAVSPLLFGTGASAAGIAGKAAESGMAPEAIAAMQRGGLSRGWDAAKGALPKIAEKITGVQSGAIEGLAKNFDKIAELEKDPLAITKMSTKAATELGSTLRTAKKESWNQFEQALSAVPGEVDVTGAKEALKNAIAHAEAGDTGTEASQELVGKLKDAFGKYFTREGETQVPVKQATGILDASGQPIMKDAMQSVKGMEELTTLSPTAAAQLERQLGELADLGSLGPIKGGVGNRFAPSATAGDKAVATAAAGAKSELGDAIAQVLPPEALAAKANYGRIANLEKETKPLFKNTDKAFRTLRNLGRVPNQAKQEMLNQVDQQLGTSMIPQANLASAYSAFAKPGALPISAGGVSGLARAGMLGAAGSGVGYEVDKHYGSGSGLPGAAIGGALGAFAGSPAMLRRYIGMGLKAQGVADALPNFVTPAAASTAWGALTK